MARDQATLAACQLRLRPIIMTSFAFILGVVPLMLSEGAGAEMGRTLGTAVFAGMLGAEKGDASNLGRKRVPYSNEMNRRPKKGTHLI